MMLFDMLITDMMVICGANENEAAMQFVTPRFHPNLINNMLSMPKCVHSYTLLT